MELLGKESQEFIPPQLWPPNSQDLNAADYSVREIMQEKVYSTHMDELKQRLRTEWAKLAAIRQWRCCLSACVKAGGRHFEHHL